MPRAIDRIRREYYGRFGPTGDDVRVRPARTVPAGARRYWYCFGGLAFFSAILQALSGVFMAFYYQPTPDKAYASVFYISNYVHYGWLIRSIHVWGARLMIALVVVHMIRVFVTGSYKHPREFNWVVGVLLLAVTMAFAVTGDLLPWEQSGYWSTKSVLALIGEVPLLGSLLVGLATGGRDLGAAALTRFYASHIMLLPAVLTALLLAHFWMVRRQGISRPL
ncbi:MAG TPA: cytochrome b N-terminal domain-containing protein [Coriobacteriia bacterium]|nr:cytochrome b N-terminal domain-containing protein [Coriobacteriia bacterium]